jgi:diaminopimelate decarboxylase
MNVVSEKHGRSIKMILEPGRIIGSSAGYFVCKVTDIKKRNGNILLGVNASSVQFPRPLFYPDTARHPAILLHNREVMNSHETQLTSVYGCSTYSRDFLTRDIQLPHAEIGDIIVLGNAGSYSRSSYTEFLGFPKPKEIFV